MDEESAVQWRGQGRRNSLSNELIVELIADYNEGVLTVRGICDKYGIAHGTLYRYLRKEESDGA